MTTEKLQIYRCEVCGNLVQVLLGGIGELVCCSREMKLQIPQHDTGELGEKHAPKQEIRDGKKYVTVKNHPMTGDHYIQLIEVYKKDKSGLRLKYFEPKDTPKLEIPCPEDIEALEFCNIHGLWGEDYNGQR